MRGVIVMIALLTVGRVMAQEQPEEARQDLKAQEKIKAARAAYITERLGLTAEEAEKFWPIYHEFNEKREKIRERFKQDRQSNKSEKEMLDLEFKLKQEQLDLEKDYSQRFQKAIPAQKLMNLRQAEGDFRKLLLRQINERQHQAERMQRQRDRRQQQLQQRNN